MTSRQLFLWRHGRTEWNASSRMQGQADIDLDDVGRAQARQSAPLLAAEQPVAIVSSDLSRARETAQALADITGLPVRLDPRLRETCFGPWEGLTHAEAAEQYPDEFTRWTEGKPLDLPGAEGPDEVGHRMRAAIIDALEATDGPVVVVTHGGAVRRAVESLLEWPWGVVRGLAPLGNCRWTELHQNHRGWQLYAHNIGPLVGAAGPHVETPAADVETSNGELAPSPASGRS